MTSRLVQMASRDGKGRQPSSAEALAALAARLRARRPEIEQATVARVESVPDPAKAVDPDYAEGLRAAVSAALDYGVAGIELGDGQSPPVPVALLAQARLAARRRVSLDTVLRRYFAGYALFGDFLLEEAERGELVASTALKRLLHTQANLFDRLLNTVSEEYAREADSHPGSQEQRRAERIERLLRGEPLSTAEFSYDFEASHLGAIVSGSGAREAIQELAAALDRRVLFVPRGDETAWAWLGGRSEADPSNVERSVLASWPEQISIAIGEPGRGLAGWRLSHRQARAALPIALRSGQPLTRYAEVALLAATLEDELFATSLQELYLTPLRQDRDGGEAALETLRAYFAAERNASSAAAALGVNRNTVTTRLRVIEAKVGRPLSGCAAEFEAALRLDEFEGPSA